MHGANHYRLVPVTRFSGIDYFYIGSQRHHKPNSQTTIYSDQAEFALPIAFSREQNNGLGALIHMAIAGYFATV